MLSVAVLIFREVLEAAMVVSIVCAAAKGVQGRGQWVSLGLLGGLIGALIVAAFAGKIANAAAGMGQELFNAMILFAAVILLGWHNVWMSQHGRELAAQVKQVGNAVLSGSRPLYALAVVVGLALLREGSEAVLFLHGLYAGGELGLGDMLLGGILGMACGCLAGFALYFGLLRFATRYLFSVTGWLILLLAAGMAAKAVGFLVQAEYLPSLGDSVWDTSWLIADHSLLGKFLNTLVGYMAAPMGIQVLAYGIVVLVIGSLMVLDGSKTKLLPPKAVGMT
jgi:high-affinity iron transporter